MTHLLLLYRPFGSHYYQIDSIHEIGYSIDFQSLNYLETTRARALIKGKARSQDGMSTAAI